MTENIYIRPIEQIVCHRTARNPQFIRDQHVIRRNATNESQSGNFVEYCQELGMAWVFWAGDTEAKKTQIANLMDIDDWRVARKRQADLKDYWQS